MDFDPSKDYYKTLGVSESASADEIKKTFRKLAMQHHPDKGGDKAKFQEINEANSVIGDEKKRSQYDSYRKGGYAAGAGGTGGGFGGFGGFGGGGGFEVDLGDVMDQFFGGGGRSAPSGPQRGEDVQISLTIDFDDAYNGTTKVIEFSRKAKIKDVKEQECPTCKGRGRVTQQSQTIFGVMQTQNICPTCQGIGKTYTKDGKKIPGGLELQKQELTVNIPAGIKDGIYIRHSGKGDDGFGGGPSGDLYIQIKVKSSSIYSRQGDDLYMSISVSLYDMILGGEMEIKHPTGPKTIKIPKGTQLTDKIKISNLGFMTKGGVFGTGHGNLYIIPQVSLPKKLSKEEEQLWTKLRDTK